MTVGLGMLSKGPPEKSKKQNIVKYIEDFENLILDISGTTPRDKVFSLSLCSIQWHLRSKIGVVWLETQSFFWKMPIEYKKIRVKNKNIVRSVVL